MNRLAIRFYAGALIALLVALLVQTIIYWTSWAKDNQDVVETGYSGIVSLAREKLEAAPKEARAAVLADLSRRSRMPVTAVPWGSPMASDAIRARLSGGADPVWGLAGPYGSFVYGAMNNKTELVIIGPLPPLRSPAGRRLAMGLSIVLVLVGILSVLLVRPIVLQLRGIETACADIARGELSVRLDESAFPQARTVAKTFNLMASRIGKLVMVQRELLQSVAHELRTPLARIRFGLELIGDALEEDEGKRRQLERIDDAIEELDEHVTELLHFVRLQAELDQTAYVEVSIKDAFDQAMKSCSLLHSGIAFEWVDGPEGRSPVVLADRRDVFLALRNLLLNAGRFAKARVVVSHRMSGKMVEIDVEDDGPGIPPEDRERVFEPYVRLQKGSRGLGLGLSIVRRTLERCGGKVTLSSSRLGGCRFTLQWPLPGSQVRDGGRGGALLLGPRSAR